MVHKKNGKSKANQTTTLKQKKDTSVSAIIKLAGKAAQIGNLAASQQITIDALLVHIVKLEEHVIALEGGLASASHVTSVLQKQLTAKTYESEMYSRSCIVLTGLCKENRNLNKLKERCC